MSDQKVSVPAKVSDKSTGVASQKKKTKTITIDVDSEDETTTIINPPGGAVVDQKDTKAMNPAGRVDLGSPLQMAATMHQLMQRKSRGQWQKGGKKGNWNYRSFSCKLAVRNQATGSSGSAYFPVTVLQPNSTGVTEAQILSSLFDEQRCKAITFHIRATATTTPVAPAAWAFCYDIGNSGAYTSVVGVMLSGFHRGPFGFNNTISTYSMDKTGYQKMTVKLPNPVLPTAGSSASNEAVGSGWYASSDTLVSVGYLKFAADAITSGIVEFDYFIEYHMEYRERT